MIKAYPRCRRTRHPSRLTRQSSAGFTMTELLVVIVIIAMLLGLLLPAIQGAVRKGKEAACSADINLLVQALASFKNKYGDYPPSRIIVVENGNYTTGTGTPIAALGLTANGTTRLVTRSVSYLKKFWPRIRIDQTNNAGVFTAAQITAGGYYDVNGNGNLDGAYILTGPQCLVFFLGGIPQVSGEVYGMTGFSKNPENPFLNPIVASNRQAPFMEFVSSRLVPDPVGVANDWPPFPGYVDPLGSWDNGGNPPFYAYFSSYGSSGYDPGDYDVSRGEAEPSGSVAAILGAFVGTNAATNNVALAPGMIASAPPNPYTTSPPVPTDNSGSALTSYRPITWVNPNSFQIISPGWDRLWGIGGQYYKDAKGTAEPLPFVTADGYKANSLQAQKANKDVTKQDLGLDVRKVEEDNLSNFASGRLK